MNILRVMVGAIFLLSIGGQLFAEPKIKTVITIEKSYYLTADLFQGNEAIEACDVGYHLASVWELLDISSWVYNTELGLSKQDSGMGPPDGDSGWIRSGGYPDATANCLNWTSIEFGHYGLSASLRLINLEQKIDPSWDRAFVDCEETNHVWCVSDSVY